VNNRGGLIFDNEKHPKLILVTKGMLKVRKGFRRPPKRQKKALGLQKNILAVEGNLVSDKERNGQMTLVGEGT